MGKRKSKTLKRKSAVAQHELPLEKLRTEANFLRYMKLLKQFAKKYCVMIVASDTPVGPATTREMTGALLEMGLRIDLYGKFRCAYAAMLDTGTVIFEELKTNATDMISQEIIVRNKKVRLVSTGFNNGSPEGSILIDGKNYSKNRRGLNIVVYDKIAEAILDWTAFDLYIDTFPRFSPYLDMLQLREFERTHPGVRLVCARFPAFPADPVTPGERFIQEQNLSYHTILRNLRQHVFALNKYFDEAGIAEVLSVPKSYFDLNGVRRFEDAHGKHINISGGHRETAYQPETFQRTIFLVGGCAVFGIGTDDKRTAASYLQEQCNRYKPDAGLVVQNYGYYLAGDDIKGGELFKIMNNLPAKPGDIVVCVYSIEYSEDFLCIDLSRAAEGPRSYEVFFDKGHFTPGGYRLIGEGLFKGLMDLELLSSPENPALQPELTQDNAVSDDLPGSDLRSMDDFAGYLKLLKRYARRYCVLVNSSDTAWGPGFTKEISRLYREVGFQADLNGKFRRAYAAAIDAGELVYEELCEDVRQYIDVTLTSETGDFQASILSKGYYTLQTGDKNLITVNGKVCSSGRRGLNFVVYDKASQAVIDEVNFDTFSEVHPCYRYQERAQRWKKYMTDHPGVSIISFNCPSFPPDEYLTPRERFIKENHVVLGTILNNRDKPVFTLSQYFDADGIAEVLKVPESYHDMYGVRRFVDVSGKHVNIANGHRVTAYQPERTADETIRYIYLVGGCQTYGVGTDDSRTIASYLQALLNTNLPEQKFVVENYGYCLAETDGRGDERLAILQSLPVKPNDIVLCDDRYDFPLIDSSKTAMKPRDFDAFTDKNHPAPGGYRLVAEKIFEDLMKMGILNKANTEALEAVHQPAGAAQREPSLEADTYKELAEYKKDLTDWYNQTFSRTIGSVVMNCNPFTLGHRFLVEQALEQCDFLIIFVVQEDKSRFPFEERLRLVKEGVADLEHVAVFPSGKFVLSSLTFSEYFNKSELQDRTIDTSLDVTVFAREIAPCLHITKRFAGEEPCDTVTRQYNETMRRILPEYGIEFVEFPRKTDVRGRGTFISASRVRELLKKRDFEAIKPLVPETTFQYLLTVPPDN